VRTASLVGHGAFCSLGRNCFLNSWCELSLANQENKGTPAEGTTVLFCFTSLMEEDRVEVFMFMSEGGVPLIGRKRWP
jgi:hypothetical protein